MRSHARNRGCKGVLHFRAVCYRGYSFRCKQERLNCFRGVHVFDDRQMHVLPQTAQSSRNVEEFRNNWFRILDWHLDMSGAWMRHKQIWVLSQKKIPNRGDAFNRSDCHSCTYMFVSSSILSSLIFFVLYFFVSIYILRPNSFHCLLFYRISRTLA